MNDPSSTNAVQGKSRAIAPVVSDIHQAEWDMSLDEGVQGVMAANPLGPALAWQSFRHWWRIAFPVGILLAGMGVAAVWLTFEQVYEAQALLTIASSSEYIFFARSGARIGSDRFERTQVELIRSAVVLDRVIERPEIASLPEILTMDSPADTLSEELVVGSQNESDLFYVRFESSNPEAAAAIVNAVVTEYVQLQDNEANRRTGLIIKLVGEEVEKRDAELKDLRIEVQGLERSLPDVVSRLETDGGRNVSGPRSVMDARLAQLINSIVERELLIATVKAYEETMTNQQTSVPADETDQALDEAPENQQTSAPAEVIDQAVDESPEIVRLQRLLAAARMNLADARSAPADPDSDPGVLRYERQIQDYEHQMEELRPQLAARLELQWARTEQSRLATEVARMKANIRFHETFERLLTEKMDEQRQPLEPSVEGGFTDEQLNQLDQLQGARADLARAEQVNLRMLERADMLKTESRLPSRVSFLRPANVPSTPNELFPLRKMITAAAVGLVLPFLLAFLWEFRIQRVIAGEQISHNSVLPLLVEIPKLPTRSLLVTARSSSRQLAVFQNSMHYLCRNLLLSDKACDLQVLAITSAISGEGKTTLASHLALSLALYSGERVLLIDADLRRPSLHDLFDIPLGPGLAELLTSNGNGNVTLETAIRADRPDLVSVLPAGKLTRHPHAVLGAGRFETLLDTIRQSYRYVIIDTPPVIAAGEALSLCKCADGTLLSVMQVRSRRKEVLLAYERLISTGATPLGVVLNGVSGGHYSGRYSYYDRAAYEPK